MSNCDVNGPLVALSEVSEELVCLSTVDAITVKAFDTEVEKAATAVSVGEVSTSDVTEAASDLSKVVL